MSPTTAFNGSHLTVVDLLLPRCLLARPCMIMMSSIIRVKENPEEKIMKEIVLMVTCGGAAATDDLRRKTTVLYRQIDAGQQVVTHSKRSHSASMFKLLK